MKTDQVRPQLNAKIDVQDHRAAINNGSFNGSYDVMYHVRTASRLPEYRRAHISPALCRHVPLSMVVSSGYGYEFLVTSISFLRFALIQPRKDLENNL